MIVLKDCLCVVRPTPSGSGHRTRRNAEFGDGKAGSLPEGNLAGADIHIEGNRIARVGRNLPVPEGARVIDASRHVVMPGLVNTHHHFYQTLTRNLPAVQNAKLFDWLVYLYEVWKGIDEEAVYWSSRLALAELVKTGCTCTTDHHYLYPRGFSEDLPGLQFKAASDIGMRFAPTRGSMCRSKKDGGLPPDSVVQDEDEILAQSEETIRKYHDPAPDSMRRVALAPCSPFSVSEQLMKDSAVLARKHGARLHTHLAETGDEDDYCVQIYGRRPLKVMEDCGFIGPDVWYAHGIHFNDDELDELGQDGHRRSPLPLLQHAPRERHLPRPGDAGPRRARGPGAWTARHPTTPPTCSARCGRPSCSSGFGTAQPASRRTRSTASRPRAEPASWAGTS